MNNPQTPVLSVIIIVIDGATALRRCLEALRAQKEAPPLDIIVPFDEAIAEIGDLRADFPETNFVDLGTAPGGGFSNAFEEHNRLDLRRARGLDAATGDLIAMIEDRGWPRDDWARAMVNLHATHPHPAIGGAVENASPNMLMGAVFKCDFARSEPPFETGESEFLTDINICYKRASLLAIRNLWAERYHEVTVNWGLQTDGATLLRTQEPIVVMERQPRSLGDLLKERFHWGRVFGRVRVANAPRINGVAWAAFTPILPFVLLARIFRLHREKGRSLIGFFNEAPALLLLLTCWSLGEFSGYIEGAIFGAPGGKA